MKEIFERILKTDLGDKIKRISLEESRHLSDFFDHLKTIKDKKLIFNFISYCKNCLSGRKKKAENDRIAILKSPFYKEKTQKKKAIQILDDIKESFGRLNKKLGVYVKFYARKLKNLDIKKEILDFFKRIKGKNLQESKTILNEGLINILENISIFVWDVIVYIVLFIIFGANRIYSFLENFIKSFSPAIKTIYKFIAFKISSFGEKIIDPKNNSVEINKIAGETKNKDKSFYKEYLKTKLLEDPDIKELLLKSGLSY